MKGTSKGRSKGRKAAVKVEEDEGSEEVGDSPKPKGTLASMLRICETVLNHMQNGIISQVSFGPRQPAAAMCLRHGSMCLLS